MSADIEGLKKQGFEIEFVAGTTIGLTPGVVNWVLRGGAFLSSLLSSSASLFKQFDPLVVVFTQDKGSMRTKKTQSVEDRNKIEALFDKNNEY